MRNTLCEHTRQCSSQINRKKMVKANVTIFRGIVCIQSQDCKLMWSATHENVDAKWKKPPVAAHLHPFHMQMEWKKKYTRKNEIKSIDSAMASFFVFPSLLPPPPPSLQNHLRLEQFRFFFSTRTRILGDTWGLADGAHTSVLDCILQIERDSIECTQRGGD